MLKNNLKLAWRNLKRNKLYTVLNVLGLGSGMAIAILIGLWLQDELSANKYNASYDRVALLQKNRYYNNQISTEASNPVPLGAQLRSLFPEDFDEVVVSSYGGERSLRVNDKIITRRGLFMEEGGFEVMGLELIEGSAQRKLPPNAVYISKSASEALFGEESAVGQLVKIDEDVDAEILGVFKDLPQNATYKSISYYGSFEMYENMEEWVKNSSNDWWTNAFPIYVKIAENADFDAVSAKIKTTLVDAYPDVSKPELFLYPMAKWHLYPEFKNGEPVGTGLKNIWLFGIVGVLILLLASINFMNLSTARSAKRSKEIGLRKAIGSFRSQLVFQFFTETFLVVFLALIASLLMTILLLPAFNDFSSNALIIPWTSPWFISIIIGFFILTGLISGSYPALYLSSFDPVKTLKGKVLGKKRESYFRKGLVVLQFGISITLIIGAILVYQQIEFGKNRPMGYDQNNLIYFQKRAEGLKGHFDAMRENLKKSGGVLEMCETSGPVTDMWNINKGFQWQGKDPELKMEFITLDVTPEFGAVSQWNILKGRDFSREFSTDKEAMILNEAAAAQIGFENPIGQIIKWRDTDFKVIGVSKNLVMESPFEKVKPTIFTSRPRNMPFVSMQLNPDLSVSESISRVETVLREFSPNGDLNIKFANEVTGLKFKREEQVAKLAAALSVMAVFISFLGIFGLSSFMVEQRSKEIGIRKLLGASVNSVIQLMSKDFVILIGLSCLVAFPTAYFFMKNWLSKYELRADFSIWVFAAVGLSIFIMTMLTVGLRTAKAALTNPVESLKSD
jgi:putative ABC transport system permease protein